MSRISIILPVYNVEKYIVKSIQSVLAQTYTNFELLIIDDGSPDNSIALAKQFKDTRIKIFQKKNGGLSDARNYGLERAEGEYIYFMDSDDWIEPDLLEDNIKLLKKQGANVVVFGYWQDDEDKAGQLIKSTEEKVPALYIEKSKQDLPIDNDILGLLGYAWNKVYRTSFLKESNIKFEKDTSLVEDILFNSQVYHLTDTLIFNDSCYYHYLNRPVRTLMKQFHTDLFALKKRKVKVVEGFLKDWGVDLEKRQRIKAFGVVGGIRYCIHNLYAYKNQLSSRQKKQLVCSMLQDSMTKKYIDFYQPQNNRDRFYKLLIKFGMVSLITKLAAASKR